MSALGTMFFHSTSNLDARICYIHVGRMSYPTLTKNNMSMEALKAVIGEIRRDPGWLKDSPYSPELRRFLTEISTETRVVEKVVEVTGDAVRYDDDDIYGEVCGLYERIKTSLEDLKDVDAKERAQILKNCTDLLTKLVDLRSKQAGVREFVRFQKAVIEVLERVLTPDQRGEFIKILGEVSDVR